MTTTIAEIQRAILALREDDYLQLMQWIDELDWEKWDLQIERDSNSGKLDSFVQEAIEEDRQGKLTDL